jgi:RNA-directed DNA polymerase
LRTVDIIDRHRARHRADVISPLLANVYLHEVLDLWFHRTVFPRLRRRAFLVRNADDFVIAFEREDDARRVHDVLPKRFAGYGLELHPQKTRPLDFRRPRYEGRDDLENFDLLGFTHIATIRSRCSMQRWVVRPAGTRSCFRTPRA